MTNLNGVKPETEDHTPQEGTQEPVEPRMEAYSLDYWREMTERQVERLRGRVRQLEDEAAPLRMQIAALVQALRSTGSAAPAHRPGVKRDGRGVRSEAISDYDRAEIVRLAREGKTNAEIRRALPDVPTKSLLNMAYNDRKKYGLPPMQPKKARR